MLDKNFAGVDGFIWWIGVVENRQDPLELGRCQVRFFGFHSESLSDIPTSSLPWAVPVHSLNNKSFTTPKETDVVFGFFADGGARQFPIMVGIIPGIETNAKNTGAGYHDLRDLQTIRYAPKHLVGRTYNIDGSGIKLAEANTADDGVLESLRYPRDYQLNSSTISGVATYQPLSNNVISARQSNLDQGVETANNYIWDEPYPAYNPLYPYNNVTETESGHVFELDDTPRNERISMNHRSGTYWEMRPDGTMVEKVTKSNYQIVMGDDFLHVMGFVNITVDSAARIKVLGDVDLEVGNKLNAQISGDINMTAGGAFNIKSDSLNIDVTNDATLITGGSQYLTSVGDLNLRSDSGVLATAAGDLNFDAGGNLNGTGAGAVNILSGGDANIQGGGNANIVGSKVNLNSGGSAAAAAQAGAGTSAGLKKAQPVAEPNSADIPEPQEPVPLQYTVNGNNKILNPYTGSAAKVASQLMTNPNDPDGPKIEPTANTPPQECNFNPADHKFIPKDQWQASSAVIDLIHKSEGYADQTGRYGATKPLPGGGKVKAYPDPATKAEPITVGYGTTAKALAGTKYRQDITYDTVIDQSTADSWVLEIINTVVIKLVKKYTSNEELTQGMIDALCDFVWGGVGLYVNSSIRTKLQNKDYCGAADGFLKYVYAPLPAGSPDIPGNPPGKQVLPGLKTRRENERKLFLS